MSVLAVAALRMRQWRYREIVLLLFGLSGVSLALVKARGG